MRNKQNVLIGAPDVKAAGGFQITKPITSKDDLPQDFRTPIAEKYNPHPGGYVSEDGLVLTGDRSTEKIKDWNGDIILITQSDHSLVLKFTCYEAANAAVLRFIFGDDNVDDTGDEFVIVHSSNELPKVGLDFIMNGGKGRHNRLTAAEAQITNVGDVTYVRSDAIKYEVEVEVFDAFGDGDKLWERRSKGTPSSVSVDDQDGDK